MDDPILDAPPDYSSMTDEELDQIIKTKSPSSDMGFGAIAERHRRDIKKPHWTVIPVFIVGFIAMIAACIAAYPILFPTRSSQLVPGVDKSVQQGPVAQSVASSSRKQLSHMQLQLSTSRRKLP
jgi:hypothetical protein